MKRRTLAVLKIDPYEVGHAANRLWLATALETIAVELRKGEHCDSRILEIFEAEELFQQRKRWVKP